MSYDKTQIYRIGSLKHSNASLYTQQQIRWTNESINVLGVDIHWDNDVVLRKNYDKIVEKVGATLKGWSSRSLSLAGKVTIVNTLIGSLFVYNMSVIPAMSAETITKVEKLIESFLWNGRRPKIPLKVLQSPKNLGGLNLISLKAKDDAMKLTWFHILQEDEELAYLAYKNFAPILHEDIWKCVVNPEQVKDVIDKNTRPFWFDVLTAMMKLKKEEKVDTDFLWYNKDICVENKLCFWKNPYQRGLKYVGD